MPEMQYVIGKEGGEIWSDFYAVPKEAAEPQGRLCPDQLPARPRRSTPRRCRPTAIRRTDSRVEKLLPQAILDNPILYPAQELLTPLEFGAAATLTDPNRAEIMARFKAA